MASAHELPAHAIALPEWREEAIAKRHDHKSFDCGERALNQHLNARQAMSAEARISSWPST
jgi:hypothetical protein